MCIKYVELMDNWYVQETDDGKQGFRRWRRDDTDGDITELPALGSAFVYPTGYLSVHEISGLKLTGIKFSYPEDDQIYVDLTYGVSSSGGSVGGLDSKRIPQDEGETTSLSFRAELISVGEEGASGYKWESDSGSPIEREIPVRATGGEYMVTNTTTNASTAYGKTTNLGKVSSDGHWLYSGITVEQGQDAGSIVYRYTHHYDYKKIVDGDGNYGWLHLWNPKGTTNDTEDGHVGAWQETHPSLYKTTTGFPDARPF
jgi:hypothetical protein